MVRALRFRIRALSSAVSANDAATIAGETSLDIQPPVPSETVSPPPSQGVSFDTLISNILGDSKDDKPQQPATVTEGTNFAPPPADVVPPVEAQQPVAAPAAPPIEWDQSPGAVQPLQLPPGQAQ